MTRPDGSSEDRDTDPCEPAAELADDCGDSRALTAHPPEKHPGLFPVGTGPDARPDLPRDLHRRVRIAVLEDGYTLKDVITRR